MVLWMIKQSMYPLLPPHGSLPGLIDTDLDGFLRRLRSESNALLWAGLVFASIMFISTPLLTVGLPLPACLLRGRTLALHTERIIAHPWYPLRQSMSVVRLAAGMCWGADPAVRAHFRLPPYPPDPGTFRQA